MSEPARDFSGHPGMSEELDPKFHTGVGNPADPNYRKLLSAEDEKRVDDKGNLVVAGELWSKASTGLYLVVALCGRGSPSEYTPFLISEGRADIALDWLDNKSGATHKWCLTIAGAKGKPRWLQPVWGAALELPADLATDELKSSYVVEWLVETVKESLEGCGITPNKTVMKKLGAAVADAANISIRATGL